MKPIESSSAESDDTSVDGEQNPMQKKPPKPVKTPAAAKRPTPRNDAKPAPAAPDERPPEVPQRSGTNPVWGRQLL